jgi:integration host factor subunit alpha
MFLPKIMSEEELVADLVPPGQSLTKAHIAEILSEQYGFTKRQARQLVDSFFDELRSCLERGETVKLSGFGSFTLRDKPERPGRNPKTGQEIAITARRVVTFHTSQKLREKVVERVEADVQA